MLYSGEQIDNGRRAWRSAGGQQLGSVWGHGSHVARKYFFVVIGLFLTQIAMGALTAHYAVEGRAFFGLPLADVLP